MQKREIEREQKNYKFQKVKNQDDLLRNTSTTSPPIYCQITTMTLIIRINIKDEVDHYRPTLYNNVQETAKRKLFRTNVGKFQRKIYE